MATVRQYGYYVKGNKIAIVEKDTQFDNDVNSKDYGPGTDRAQWKSPLADSTDGLELQYVYSPEYVINDLDDTVTGTAYEEHEGFLRVTVPSSSFGLNSFIVIKGSERFNGVHKVRTKLDSGTELDLKTKYNGGSVTESLTIYKDVDVLNDEEDNIDLPTYLNKALVYYVKAKIAEDTLNIDLKEYFMKEFRKMVEKHNNARVAGLRVVSSGYHAVR